MPLINGISRGVIKHNIEEMVKAGHPQRVAVAAALHTAHPKGYADGGMPMSMAEPWFERRDASEGVAAYHPGGLYNGITGGRTDNIANLVPAGAYVVPADVVSGLGEGNSMAGSAIIDKMFHTNPHGVMGAKLTHGRGVGIPPAPKPFSGESQFAKGGATHEPVKIITAAGEHLIPPEAIIAKFGDLKRGHQILDEFVKHVRKKTIKEMSKLKKPVGSK